MQLFLRYFSIIYCSLYIYKKILTPNYISQTLTLLHSLFISYISLCIFPSTLSRIWGIMILSYVYITILSKTNPFISLSTTIISYGLSYGLYSISINFLGLLFILLRPNYINTTYTFSVFAVIFIHIIFTSIVFKIIQFRKGLFALINKKQINIGIFISLLFILFISHASNSLKYNLSTHDVTTIISSIIALLIPFWWRHRIKQTYIENLRRLENLTYENTIADKDKQIKELEANNAYLAQIIHKYRKVIPAMELSVMELLQNNANLDTNTLKSNAQALQVQLEELRAERNNLLDNYQKDMVVTPQSGLHTIDAMIALMEKQAKEQWVRYKTQIDPSIKELALASVKEADLLHLLGDLIENALHAVNESDHKEILIHISKLNGCLLLEVSDSGAVFDIETYQHFGNEPFTSHEADGGSGTGLMEIWKLKKEYKISLYIYEYETDSNVYTKKISFLFDKKNHFLLKTYRDKEVKNALIRGDLHVFPHKND